MQEHIVGPLEEGGIDGCNGDHALLGKTGGHADGLTLGNSHVKKAVGVSGGKVVQPRAVLHRGGDRADAPVLVGNGAEGPPEGIREGHAGFRCGASGLLVEGTDAVEAVRVLLGGRVALALPGQHVQEDRAVHLLCLAQEVDQAIDVVSVNGADVFQTHVVEHIRADQPALEPLLEAVDAPVEGTAHRDPAREPAPPFFDLEIALPGADVGQVPRRAADVRRDGHAVVVENDDQGLLAGAEVVQTLVGQTARKRAVAQQSDHAVIRMGQGPGPCHAQGHADRVGGVTGDEGVVDAFLRLGKTGHAAEFAERWKLFHPPGQQLMDVGLVSDVKNETVPGGVEDAVDGHRKLDHAQIGGQMAAGPGDRIDQVFTNLRAQLLRLGLGERGEVGAVPDLG